MYLHLWGRALHFLLMQKLGDKSQLAGSINSPVSPARCVGISGALFLRPDYSSWSSGEFYWVMDWAKPVVMGIQGVFPMGAFGSM